MFSILTKTDNLQPFLKYILEFALKSHSDGRKKSADECNKNIIWKKNK